MQGLKLNDVNKRGTGIVCYGMVSVHFTHISQSSFTALGQTLDEARALEATLENIAKCNT